MTPIDKADLRKEVAVSSIEKRITDKLAIYIMRIHDIVRKKNKIFKDATQDEIEEIVSWSLERWIKGWDKIDLQNYDNPFNYLYKGTYNNML